MSYGLFAIYHVVEEFSFDKYGLVRTETKKELVNITSSEGICKDKLKEHENKFDVTGNTVIADYRYYIPIRIEETEAYILRQDEAFKKMTSKLDPFSNDIFGFGKSESAADTLKKTEEALENVKKKGVFRR